MVREIQQALSQQNLDGWLFFDHHHRDPLSYRILDLGEEVSPSRRWYYFVPAHGAPRKLVHMIEALTLEELPGETDTYSSWNDQHAKLRKLLSGVGKVAMQYSPSCAIPYISNVDGGTLELVRSFGVDVISSADLVQEFEARWSSHQLETHLEAGRRVDQIRREAFVFVGDCLRSKLAVNEYEVQQFIRMLFAKSGLVTDHGPIVAVNQNASNPHYEPTKTAFRQIVETDVLLIDLWAKLDVADAVYYDITWTCYCGRSVPSIVSRVFDIVRDARKVASNLVIRRISQGASILGCEVDDAARNLIGTYGLANFFFHRTGHSIGTSVHGNGANMDNFESHDDRKIIPNTCFSIEPGIYLPEFGIRSEVNVFVGDGRAWVTGEEQESLVRLEG